MWDLPGSGIKPVSPALAGGFLTLVPPGKSQYCYFDSHYFGGRWHRELQGLGPSEDLNLV